MICVCCCKFRRSRFANCSVLGRATGEILDMSLMPFFSEIVLAESPPVCLKLLVRLSEEGFVGDSKYEECRWDLGVDSSVGVAERRLDSRRIIEEGVCGSTGDVATGVGSCLVGLPERKG